MKELEGERDQREPPYALQTALFVALLRIHYWYGTVSLSQLYTY